jgi:hypothetical protein
MDRRKSIGATGGAIGLGGFAALLGACCGVPWVVGIFGITGAVALARLSFIRPYAILAAAILLIAAFWFAYRPIAATGGASCDPAARRRLRYFVWGGAIVTAVLVAAALYPQIQG